MMVTCRFLPPDYSDGIEAPRLSLTGKTQMNYFSVNKVHLSQNNGALKSQNIFQLRLDYHDKLKGKHSY
jgi:hypothetical protein